MSENHTSKTSVYLIKHTDSLYVRSVYAGGVTFVKDRNSAFEFREEDKEYIKGHVELIIKLGFNKDSIFVVEESEMVVKKETEMTVDSFITPKLEEEGFIIQDVWELRD